MRILYLTKDISRYKAALYQRDFLEHLSALVQLRVVTSLEELQEINPQGYDLMIFGHEWLDSSGEPWFELPNFELLPPSIFILNKEYASLEEKLRFPKRVGAKAIVSHHNNLQSLTTYSLEGTPVYWMPFAANDALFHPKLEHEPFAFDLNFSGVLRNPTYPDSQEDFREVIHRDLFRTVNDYIIYADRAKKLGKIRWVPITGDWTRDTWNRLRVFSRMSKDEDYAHAIRTSRTTLSTLSPLGLVGTRFFECALSKSGILTPVGQSLHDLFPEEAIFRFGDSDELLEQIEFVRSDSKESAQKVEKAYEVALTNHTWKTRTSMFVEHVQSLL